MLNYQRHFCMFLLFSIVLRVRNKGYETDTDVLALLVVDFNEMAYIKLWFKSKPDYMCSYNLRDVCHVPR